MMRNNHDNNGEHWCYHQCKLSDTDSSGLGGTVWKTEAGEAGEGQIMESFAEPQGAMEAHVRVL